MGRFASTVPHYGESRPPYGSAFFSAVAARLGLSGTERLLDLGTGPGLLALGFASFVAETVGIDPEPAMLAAAREAAETAGIDLQLIEGRAEALPDAIGCFDVVSIGRALHWMEPEATRANLERVVAVRGWVAICRASSAGDGRNAWLAAYEAVRQRWTVDAPRRMSYKVQETVFESSSFHRREPVVVEAEHLVAIDTLVNRVLSMSSSSPALVGDRDDALRADMRAALRPFARNGFIGETVVARADLFRRPS